MAGKLAGRSKRRKRLVLMQWRTSQRTFDLSRRGAIMGILNVTPDSFSDGGRHVAVEAALAHARQMIAEGAEVLDIGGESTRPGAMPVSIEEEIARTVPAIRAIRQEWSGCLSIDTMKAEVAAAALEAGADVVNDVTGLTGDVEMPAVCRDTGCGVVVMHMQGTPRTMQANPRYDDVVQDVRAFFVERLETLTAAGLDARTLCFDPGIGFGKTLEHNLALLRNLGTLSPDGRPLLLGVSRKSFIGKILGSGSIDDRNWPTVALTAYGRDAGVRLHRVHDVKPNVEALRMTEAILGA
jgi:dihydropteroate synthase